jgi:hypothetical protein
VSWLRETRVQFVTAPPTYGPVAASSRITRSSTAVALKSLILGACRILNLKTTHLQNEVFSSPEKMSSHAETGPSVKISHLAALSFEKTGASSIQLKIVWLKQVPIFIDIMPGLNSEVCRVTKSQSRIKKNIKLTRRAT